MERKISVFSHFIDLVNERGINEAASFAVECGFDGVELLFSAHEGAHIPSIAEATEWKEALAEKGLSTVAVSCGASLVNDGIATRPDEGTLNALIRCADFTKAIGASLLHHTLYLQLNEPLADIDEIYGAVIEGAMRVADYASSLGLTVIYEPQGMLFNGKESFSRFITDMKSRCNNVGVCFDVGNTYWVDEEPYELLDVVKNDVRLVHLKDYVMGKDNSGAKTKSGIAIDEAPIGHGVLDIERIVSVLDRSGYSGFYSIEDVAEPHTANKIARIREMIK